MTVMSNIECAFAVLESHRLAGKWTPHSVAMDLLEQLGLAPHDDAANARPVVDPTLVTEADVVAAETAAKQATEKAEAARASFEAQKAPTSVGAPLSAADVAFEPAAEHDPQPMTVAEDVPVHP